MFVPKIINVKHTRGDGVTVDTCIQFIGNMLHINCHCQRKPDDYVGIVDAKPIDMTRINDDNNRFRFGAKTQTFLSGHIKMELYEEHVLLYFNSLLTMGGPLNYVDIHKMYDNDVNDFTPKIIHKSHVALPDTLINFPFINEYKQIVYHPVKVGDIKIK